MSIQVDGHGASLKNSPLAWHVAVVIGLGLCIRSSDNRRRKLPAAKLDRPALYELQYVI